LHDGQAQSFERHLAASPFLPQQVPQSLQVHPALSAVQQAEILAQAAFLAPQVPATAEALKTTPIAKTIMEISKFFISIPP
jgi:hypothetical protein